MSVKDTIEKKLASSLNLLHIDVLNESNNHNVPPNSETHFKLTLVSPDFEGLGLVKRHQKVYGILKDDLAGGVHALALHTYTRQEWQDRNADAPMSPPCLGGSSSTRTDS